MMWARRTAFGRAWWVVPALLCFASGGPRAYGGAAAGGESSAEVVDRLLSPAVREAAVLAFTTSAPPGPLWLVAFSTLYQYAPTPSADDLATLCPTGCVEDALQACLRPRVAAARCLLECVVTNESPSVSSAMASLALSRFYHRGSFIGTAGQDQDCPGSVDQASYLRHLHNAAQVAEAHVQRGLNKAHEWAAIYDELQLERRDARHAQLGDESASKFKRLEQEQRGRDARDVVGTIEEMARVARDLARVKYNGLAAHDVSQREACEWYEKSAALDRKAIAVRTAEGRDQRESPTPASLVMLAQCYLHGTDGFTLDEAKGVRLLQECANVPETKESADANLDTGTAGASFECMALLGTLHLWGNHGVAQDSDTAEELLKPAARSGQAFASYGLGMMWFLGFRNNTDRNYRVAAEHLERAGAQGYLLAHSYVGGMLMTGAGHGPKLDPDTGEVIAVDTRVEPDPQKAAAHFEALAMRGGPWGNPDDVTKAARQAHNYVRAGQARHTPGRQPSR